MYYNTHQSLSRIICGSLRPTRPFIYFIYFFYFSYKLILIYYLYRPRPCGTHLGVLFKMRRLAASCTFAAAAISLLLVLAYSYYCRKKINVTDDDDDDDDGEHGKAHHLPYYTYITSWLFNIMICLPKLLKSETSLVWHIFTNFFFFNRNFSASGPPIPRVVCRFFVCGLKVSAPHSLGIVMHDDSRGRSRSSSVSAVLPPAHNNKRDNDTIQYNIIHYPAPLFFPPVIEFGTYLYGYIRFLANVIIIVF